MLPAITIRLFATSIRPGSLNDIIDIAKSARPEPEG
jgi:hypothetical protein